MTALQSTAIPTVEDWKIARAKASLLQFMEWDGQERWTPAEFHKVICRKIEEVEESTRRGIGRRVMVFVPPQHGKSEICTKKAPAWLLGRNPNWGLIACSYGAELIEGFSRIARDTFKARSFIWGLNLDPSSKSVRAWGVEGHRGKLRAAGVGGAVTGEGASILFIDDPHKNREEASSLVNREAVWSFYKTVARTRLAPGGSIILIMTRWHQDDLAGRLLAGMDQDESGNLIPWEVVSFQAIAEEEDILGRKPGEILWPERYSIADYLDAKATLGTHDFTALYQQRPQPEGGAIFQRSWFKYFREEGAYYVLHGYDGRFKMIKKSDCWTFQTVDPAASEKESADYFVLSTWVVTPDKDLLLSSILREKAETTKHKNIMFEEYYRHSPLFQAVENITFGLSLVQDMKREGLPIKPVKVDKDKTSRARMAAARYEVGGIYHRMNAPWLEDFESELLIFPSGKHDDQVDNVSMAVAEVASSKKFFGEFEESVHIKDWKNSEGTPILRGWSFTNGYPVCVVGQVGDKDRIEIIGSINLSGYLIDEFIQVVDAGCLKKFGEKAVYRDFCGAEDLSGVRQADKRHLTDVELMAGYGVYASYQELTEDKYVRLVRMLLRKNENGEARLVIDSKANDVLRMFQSGLVYEENKGEQSGLPVGDAPWIQIWEGLKYIVAGVVNLQTAEVIITYKSEEKRKAFARERKQAKEVKKFYRDKHGVGGLNG